MSTAGSLLRGSALRTLDLLAVVAAAFFITPYLVHAVGPRVYGFWTLALSLIGYYGLLDMGLTSAAARYLSQALGRGDAEELDRFAGTALSLFTVVGAVVLALSVGSAAASPWFVRAPRDAAVFRWLIVLIGASAAASFPAKAYSGLLQAGLRHDALAAISIARTLGCNGAIWACLRARHGIVSVAAVTLAANLLQSAALYAAARALFPKVSVSLRRADLSRVRAMASYGVKTLVAQLGDVLRFRLDTVLIAAFLGAAAVTPYAVGARIVEAFVQLVFGSVTMMLPVFSLFEGRGDYDAIRRALLRTTKATTIVSTFIGLDIILYGHLFVRRWMGPGFDSAYGVCAILAAGYVIELPQTPGIQLLYGLSRHHTYAALTIAEGVVNLALSVWLLKRYGLYGVALGTTVSFALFKLLVQPALICRPVGVPVRSYLGTIFVTVVKTAAPLGVFYALARPALSASYLGLAACGAAQTALLAPVAWLFVLDAGERAAVRRAVSAAIPRRRSALAAAAEG